MRTVIEISHDTVTFGDHDEYESIQEAIAAAVDDRLPEGTELDEITVDDVTVRLDATREGWEPGKPCPDCDSTEVSVMALNEERYTSEDGTFEFSSLGEVNGPHLSVICGRCTTRLDRRDVTLK